MIKKLHYSTEDKYKVEVLENDIVKVLGKETLYKIECVHNSDIGFYFGTCAIIDIDTYTEGYVTIPISDLVFIEREFYDPDHF
jgi:hypothetical protein